MTEDTISIPVGQLAVLRKPAPGRLRLRVNGLYRRRDRAAVAEAALAALGGVRVVRASALTGNVLVLFDPAVVADDSILAEGTKILTAALNGHGTPTPVGKSSSLTSTAGDNSREFTIARKDGAGSSSMVNRFVESTGRQWSPEGEPWHALGAAETAAALETDPRRGLAPEAVQARRRLYGPNLLPEPSPPSVAKMFLSQLANAPSALLGAGAVLSLATGGIVDAVLIGAVLMVNATIGAATERSGHRAIAALKRSVAIRARVRRGGVESVVEASDLVQGDVITLLPGDPVPADGRLTYAHRLQIEESTLTGEPHPVDKEVEACASDAALADRTCMVYRGTTAVAGHGEAIVVATGGSTVVGRLRALAAGAAPPAAPLERDLDDLGRKMAVAATGICGGVFGLTLLRRFGLVPAISTAVSLAIAAIPEGLAAIATTILALGSGRMRKKGTLIRSLHAAEALGSVTVVCVDKTGTITENRMAARECTVNGHTFTITGGALSTKGEFLRAGKPVLPENWPGLMHTLRIGALCTDAEMERLGDGSVVIAGSPTEGALLVAAAKAGLDPAALAAEYPRIDRLDRGDGRRYMVTVHRVTAELLNGASGEAPGGLVALAKGSPEEILEICHGIERGGQVVPLDDSTRKPILAANTKMAGRGLRVLALAARAIPDGYQVDDLGKGFVWYGHIGLADPIRPAVPAAIQALHGAGIRTVMITGDQAPTAAAVASELNLSRRGSLQVLEANELGELLPEVLQGKVKDIGIFARVPPEMKLSVVRALQANGDIVAMTGDGVNDAAALRAADVGVAMGDSGTELARELADVVLSTDDFSRFVDAVEEGRVVRANVRRVLHYLLATNASEVWMVSGAVAMGLASPLTPLQLLWLNLVSDIGPAIGLATDAATRDLMTQPPRDPKEPIVPAPMMRRILGESFVISLGALGTYAIGLMRHGPGSVAQTMAFASLTGAQLLHVPIARAGNRPTTEGARPANGLLTLGVGASVLLQLGAIFFPPLGTALGGARIGLVDALWAALGSALPIAAIFGARALRAPAATGKLPHQRQSRLRALPSP